MEPADKPQFLALLANVLAAYGKPMPEAPIAKAWIANLMPYPLPTIERAFRSYCDENGEFAPVPAGIAMRCKAADGRPGAEEAWAIALTVQDESDTVVWTREMAEAYSIAKPVLMSSGAISARKSFLEAYSRLVADARAGHIPAQWSVSEGWDGTKRLASVKRAVAAGLLPPPQVTALLEGPAGDPTPDESARTQLASIRKMLTDSAAAREAEREARIEREHAETEEWKRATNAAVALRLESDTRQATNAPDPVRSDIQSTQTPYGGSNAQA